MAGRRRYKPSLDAAKEEALRACDFFNQRRRQRIPVANLDRLRPGEVVKRIAPRVPAFNLTYHTYATRHFKVRPRGGASDPTATVTAFCLYDAAHGDYMYTQAWVNRLLRELEPDPDATLAAWRREALAHQRADRAATTR